MAEAEREKVKAQEIVELLGWVVFGLLLPDWLLAPPGSTVFILCFSALITLITSLVNRILVDREQLNGWQREIREWTANSKKAKRTGDKKLVAKVQKQQSRIMQLQGKVFKQSLKPMVVYFVPFMLLWQLFLIPLFSVGTMAYFPGLSGGYIELPLFLWYLICSFASGTLISRALGVPMGTSGAPS